DSRSIAAESADYSSERHRVGRAQEAADRTRGSWLHSSVEVAIRCTYSVREEKGWHHANVRRLPCPKPHHRQEQLPASEGRRAVRSAARRSLLLEDRSPLRISSNPDRS